jgi:hypothetical protein
MPGVGLMDGDTACMWMRVWMEERDGCTTDRRKEGGWSDSRGVRYASVCVLSPACALSPVCCTICIHSRALFCCDLFCNLIYSIVLSIEQ